MRGASDDDSGGRSRAPVLARTRLYSDILLSDKANEVASIGTGKIVLHCSVPEAVKSAMHELAKINVPFAGYAKWLCIRGTVTTLRDRRRAYIA